MAAVEWPIRGRDEDIRALGAALDDPDRRGAVLVGPQGVGRSRLAREAQRHATDHGRPCAWATGSRAAADVPFGALAHLLPDNVPAPDPEHPTALLRRAEAIVAGIGDGGRAVVVVDDAHLVDGLSAAFLHHLAAQGLADVVLTVRSDIRPPDPVTALGKDELVDRIDVGPLDQAAFAELLTDMLGGRLDPVSLRRLWRTTGGNPLFLREVVGATLGDGSLRHHRGLWQWDGALTANPRLVELVGARLGPAEGSGDGEDGADHDEGPNRRDVDPGRAVLDLLACGEPLALVLAESVVVPADLEAAERSGVVEHHGKHLRFVHPLYREVLWSTMPAGRRRALCEQLATAAAERGPVRGKALVQVAVWQLEAETPAERRAVSLAAAAREALRTDDPGLAERLARAALDTEGTPALVVLAEALEKQGRHDDVVRLLRESPVADDPAALRLAWAGNLYWAQEAKASDPFPTDPTAADAASPTIHWPRTGAGTTPSSAADLVAGFAASLRAASTPTRSEGGSGGGATPPLTGSGGGGRAADPAAASEEAATDAWLLFFESELPRCIEVVRRVFEQPASTARAQVWSATVGAAALALRGRSDEALLVADLGDAAADEMGGDNPWARPEVSWARVLARVTSGDLAGAHRLVGGRADGDTGGGTDTDTDADTHDGPAGGSAQLTGMTIGFQGMVARLRGDHHTAVASLRDAVVLMDRADMYQFSRLWLAELAAALATCGDAAGARVAFDEAWARGAARGTNRVFDPWIRLAGAWTRAAEGRLGDAVTSAVEAADVARDLGQHGFEVTAAYDVARLGRPELVEERLSRAAAGTVDGGLAPACRDAAAGLAARAPEGLLECSERFEELGHVLLAAETATAAQAQWRADGNPRAAAPAGERARRLRARCSRASTPLLGLTSNHLALTYREREIVGLAAAGRSSPEIARLLHLSPRTVDNHLGRAYAKLGVRGRAQLQAVLGT